MEHQWSGGDRIWRSESRVSALHKVVNDKIVIKSDFIREKLFHICYISKLNLTVARGRGQSC